MPRKKLTKAQVKRKVIQLNRILYDLFLDKMGYGTDSEVPFSKRKLMEMQEYTLPSRVLR